MGNHKSNPFARGNSRQPSTTLLDALGREVQAGDLVICPMISSPIVRVVQVKPDLSITGGGLNVIIQYTQAVKVPAGRPLSDFVLVALKPEPGDAPPADPSADPPEPPAGEVVALPDGPKLVTES